MAFVPSTPSIFEATRRARSHPCICMKRGSSGSKKKVKGFATNPKTTSKKRSSRPDGVREKATGEEGNATPHRVSVLNVQKLQDPRNEVVTDLSESEDKVKTFSATDLESFRLSWDIGRDELIEKFEDARKNDTLDAVVWANRHLVTEALLYRFTSTILRVESEKQRTEWKEESRNMRELRRRLIAASWDFDLPFKRGIMAAEERLMNVLQSGDVRKSFVQRAGASEQEVDAMWIVVYAAVSAWEEQGQENQALRDVDVQKALTTVAGVFGEKKAISDLLRPCLKISSEVLNLANPVEQALKLDGLGDEDVVQLGAFVEQIRLLPTNAYSGLTQRMETILDFVLAKRYNRKSTNATMEPVRFTPPASERESSLVNIAQTSSLSGEW